MSKKFLITLSLAGVLTFLSMQPLNAVFDPHACKAALENWEKELTHIVSHVDMCTQVTSPDDIYSCAKSVAPQEFKNLQIVVKYCNLS